MTKTILIGLVAAAIAVAGCAGNGGTTTTSTPPANTTTTTTTPTTPVGNDTMEPLDCPDSPASGQTTPGDVVGYPEWTFTVDEGTATDPCFGFVGPASVPAGWTALTLRNDGNLPHIMPVLRVENGTITRDEIRAALAADREPEGVTPVGGIGLVTPFSSGTAIIELEEGTYVVICFFGGHHAQGMYRVLNVTAAEGAALDEPTANFTITLDDFSFGVPNITAGTHIVKFVNDGAKPHEAPLIKLNANTTIMEFLAAVQGAQSTPPPQPGTPPPGGGPPGRGVGGVNEIPPSGSAFIVVDFEAGDYGMACFVDDEATDKSHVELGMVTQFTVEEA